MIEAATPERLGVPKRNLGTRWWTFCRNGGGRMESLTVRRKGEGLMPVFCFREEAEMFLRFDGLAGAGWGVRESTAGELASILCDFRVLPRDRVGGVALDPLPVAVDGGIVMDLARVGREAFLRRLLAGPGRR